MFFGLLSFVLVAGIAFFQALQGVYSAIIMAVLTMVSAALAVNFYHPLATACLAQLPSGWGQYIDAISLATLFFVTLVLLRTVADRVLRGNIVIQPIPDRILAGVISFPTAMVIVGMASISMQMLPFDQTLMMFTRYNMETGARASLFPKADDFTASVLTGLSKGALSGDTEFGMFHDDWPGELSAQRMGVQHESKQTAPENSVSIVKAWAFDKPLLEKQFTLKGFRLYEAKMGVEVKGKRLPQSGMRYIAMLVNINGEGADDDRTTRIGWGQVRLVGFVGGNTKRPQSYYLMGFKDVDVPGEWNVIRKYVPVRPTKEDEQENQATSTLRNYGLVTREKTQMPLGLVFEVPDDFKPWFVEYKRWGRVAVPELTKDQPAEAPAAAGAAAVDSNGNPVARSGWHSQFQVDFDRSGFNDTMPFSVAMAAGTKQVDGAEISQGRITKGTIYGTIGRGEATDLDSKTNGRLASVQGFFVPNDRRLFRLECKLEAAQTALLQSVFGAVQGVMQRFVVDAQGQNHFPVGQYIILDGQPGQEVELMYDCESEQTAGGYAKPFQHMNPNQLAGKTVRIGFLFMVPAGTQLKQFEVGGGAIEAQNLTRFTAPQ